MTAVIDALDSAGHPRRLVILLAAFAAVIGTASVRSPLLVVAVTAGITFVVIAMLNLAAGVAVFTTLIFLEQIPSISSSGLTLTKLAGGTLAVAWVVAAGKRRPSIPLLTDRHPALAFSALALLCWTTASMLWATDPSTAGLTALRFSQGVLLVFIVFSAVRERRQLIWIIYAFLIGAALTAVVGLAGVTSAEGADVVPSDRLTGSIGDPNELAAILLPALSLALFTFMTRKGVLMRGLLLVTATLCAVALFRTESRGGLVGLAAMLLAAVVLSGPVRARVVALVLTLSGFALAYFTLVAPPQSFDRLTSFSADAGSGRLDIWSVALAMSRDHPLLGVGAGNFTIVEPAYAIPNLNLPRFDLIVDTPKVVHNMYLHVLVELGIVGLALFVVVIALAFASAFHALRTFVSAGDLEMEILTRGIIIGAIGMLAAFFFLSAQYEKQLPLLLGMLAALSSLTPNHVRPVAGDSPYRAHDMAGSRLL